MSQAEGQPVAGVAAPAGSEAAAQGDGELSQAEWEGMSPFERHALQALWAIQAEAHVVGKAVVCLELRQD